MSTVKEVKIELGKPRVLYDVVVKRKEEAVVWWAPGSDYLRVYFEPVDEKLLEEDKVAKKKIQPEIRLDSGGFFSLNVSEHDKVLEKKDPDGQGTSLKYTIEARYPGGSVIFIDPKVKIQP